MTQKIRLYLRSSRFLSPALIVFFILFANGLYLTNYFKANPVFLRSGLINSIDQGPSSGQYTIDPSDGFYAQALGHRVAVDAAKGQIPWWNHYEGIGAPLMGGMQSAALFPLQFLLAFPNGLFYFHLSLEILAALATYYFLRRLKCNNAAAMLGGMAFGINGTFSWIAHTIFNPIAFLPLLLLGIEMALQAAAEGRKRGWLLIAVAIAGTLYAGFPETGFINAMFAGIWALVRLSQLTRQQYKAYFVKLVGGALLGLAAAAPILIAFATYLPHANVGIHAGSTANLILPMIGLSGLIMPYVYGPIFALWGYDTSMTLYSWWANVGGYVAITLLPLAIIGIRASWVRRRERLFLLGWVLFCVFASFGILGLNHIAGNIPILSLAAFCRYFPPTYEFAIIVLLAMGLTDIWQKQSAVLRRPAIIGGGLTFIMVGAATLLGLTEFERIASASNAKLWFFGSFGWAMLATGLLTLAIMFFNKLKVARAALFIIILTDVAAMYAIPMFAAPRQATIDLKPVNFLRENLGNQRFFSLGPIQPNYGTYYRIAQANINDVPQPRSYSEYISKKLDSNVNPITFTGTNWLDSNKPLPPEAFLLNMENYEAIGVKYVITFPHLFTSQQISDNNLALVFSDEISEIYQLPNPRAYFSTKNGRCQIAAESRDKLTATCIQATKLVRLEQYFPGWVARIDGAVVPIASREGLVQEIALPAGTHTVTYQFSPEHITWGYGLLTLSGLIVFGVYCRPRYPKAVLTDLTK